MEIPLPLWNISYAPSNNFSFELEIWKPFPMAQKQFPVQVTRYRNVDYKTSNIYIKNPIIFNLILKFLKSDKNISVV